MLDSRAVPNIIHDFTDLLVWQKAHVLVVSIYKLVIKFPNFEKYGLADQLRRASVSITSNIAEGFGRHGMKEKIQFYYLAAGSLTEVRNQLLIAKDVGYLSNLEEIEELLLKVIEVGKILSGLIRSSKARI